MRIAFIGLGAMGAGMAANQVKKGRTVIAFDLVKGALDKAKSNGCEIAGSTPEAVKGADAVITMLPAGQHVLKVFAEEVLANAPKTALLADCSTIDVDTARKVAAMAKEGGFTFADAPVSGGTAGADAGTLAFMVGCDEPAFPRYEELLTPMARAIFRAGDHGAGQAAKICNNMALGIQMIGVCEAFALAERLGLDPKRFFEIASQSSSNSWSLNYSPWPGLSETSASTRGYAGGFATALMLKDLKLAQEAAARSGAATPLGAQAEALYALLDRQGYGGKDFSSMLQFLRGKLAELA
jgi:3-hydroxyisobutyrate dehydrogenase